MTTAEYKIAYPYLVVYLDEWGNLQTERWSVKTLAEELVKGEVKILRVDHTDTLQDPDE